MASSSILLRQTILRGADQSACRLLSIPQEVRDMVYAYALTTDSPIFIWGNTYAITRQHADIGAAILRTCKQIHNETKDLLYKDNTFLVSFNFDTKAGRWINVLHNVIPTYPATTEWQTVRQIAVKTHNIYVPMEKIRNLEVHLIGPGGRVVKRDEDLITNAALRMGGHLGAYFATCVNRCSDLQKLCIMPKGWTQSYAKSFLDYHTRYQLQGVACRGRIEWIQDKKDGDTICIANVTMDLVKGWLYESAIEKGVKFVIE